MPDYDVFLSQLFDQYINPRIQEQKVGAYLGTAPSLAFPQQHEAFQRVKDLIPSYSDESQSLLTDQADPNRIAREKLRNQIARMQEEKAQKEQQESELKQQESDWYYSSPDTPDPQFSDPDKGQLMAQLSPEKLKLIRAQAYLKGKQGDLQGRGGSKLDELIAAGQGMSPSGGRFSQQPESPELTQRLAERDKWAEGQDLRDARWDADLARQRRDQPGQQLAANRLASLKEQRLEQQKQDSIDKLLASVSDGTGKIDPDTYRKLGMLGQHVPSSMVGMGKEEVVNGFNQLIESGSKTISQLAPNAMFDPTVKQRIDAERKGVNLAMQFQQMVSSGQMSPEEAWAAFNQAMMMDQYVQSFVAQKLMPQQVVQTEGE